MYINLPLITFLMWSLLTNRAPRVHPWTKVPSTLVFCHPIEYRPYLHSGSGVTAMLVKI